MGQDGGLPKILKEFFSNQKNLLLKTNRLLIQSFNLQKLDFKALPPKDLKQIEWYIWGHR